MVLNIITRGMFFSLLLASLSIDAFVFSPWWLIPPVVAILLNYRVARSMHYGHRRDILFAVLLLPAEIYMWIRIGHFVRAWSKFASRKQTDNWAAQAKAERGSGNSYLYPFAIALLVFAAAAAAWMQLPIGLKSDVLSVGWPILGVITVSQTFWMGIKILRNYRGYTV
ncbi:MAG: hypothetical protein EON53_01395 [Actinomycetales bacterium]|nr:MAG: hypothetical protein EON53_01395 [Actinomycetales bacterium]